MLLCFKENTQFNVSLFPRPLCLPCVHFSPSGWPSRLLDLSHWTSVFIQTPEDASFLFFFFYFQRLLLCNLNIWTIRGRLRQPTQHTDNLVCIPVAHCLFHLEHTSDVLSVFGLNRCTSRLSSSWLNKSSVPENSCGPFASCAVIKEKLTGWEIYAERWSGLACSKGKMREHRMTWTIFVSKRVKIRDRPIWVFKRPMVIFRKEASQWLIYGVSIVFFIFCFCSVFDEIRGLNNDYNKCETK